MTGSDASPLRLRRATERDLSLMAKVHRAAYGPGHFLALLPESVLSEYYRLFLDGGSQAIVAEFVPDAVGEGTFGGFAVFGANIEPRIGVFKRQQRGAIVRTALLHPAISLRKVLMRVLGYPSGDAGHAPAAWLLLSIAVSGGRRGVGTALLREMLRVASVNGQDRFGLYVRHSNFAAVNAYLRAGFRIVATIADQYYMEAALQPSTSSGTH